MQQVFAIPQDDPFNYALACNGGIFVSGAMFITWQVAIGNGPL